MLGESDYLKVLFLRVSKRYQVGAADSPSLVRNSSTVMIYLVHSTDNRESLGYILEYNQLQDKKMNEKLSCFIVSPPFELDGSRKY